MLISEHIMSKIMTGREVLVSRLAPSNLGAGHTLTVKSPTRRATVRVVSRTQRTQGVELKIELVPASD